VKSGVLSTEKKPLLLTANNLSSVGVPMCLSNPTSTILKCSLYVESVGAIATEMKSTSFFYWNGLLMRKGLILKPEYWLLYLLLITAICLKAPGSCCCWSQPSVSMHQEASNWSRPSVSKHQTVVVDHSHLSQSTRQFVVDHSRTRQLLLNLVAWCTMLSVCMYTAGWLTLIWVRMTK